jgi:predicted kinase
MDKAQIVIVSGAPGAGKSTIARILAKTSPFERAVHIHTDDFYRYICKGYIEPWKAESNDQNIAVSNAMVNCALGFCNGGYEAIIDGIVGPWFLKPWIDAAKNGASIHYIVIRPDLETSILRATTRTGKDDLTDVEVVKKMWRQFADLGPYEKNAINTAGQAIEQSAASIRDLMNLGNFLI